MSELDEEGTRISLTIVDTPGFGDQIDNEARYVGTIKRVLPKLTMMQLPRDRRIP
jgi:cell division control protein 11